MGGLKGLYTTRSAGYSFMPEEGVVGRVFSDQKMLFVPDLQALSEEEVRDAMFSGERVAFARIDLAKEFDIHSAVFLPQANSVIEVGSVDKAASLSDLIPEALLKTVSPRSESPLPFETPARVGGNSGSALLQRIVEGSCGGCYGIEWVVSEAGRLECARHYNPQWRIEGVRQRGLKGLYTTRSVGYSFMPGEGVVGKVFSDQKMLFVPDLQALSEEEVRDAMFSGERAAFARIDLAKEFDIHSAVYLPQANGVIEVGSVDKAAALSDFVPEAVLKLAELA